MKKSDRNNIPRVLRRSKKKSIGANSMTTSNVLMNQRWNMKGVQKIRINASPIGRCPDPKQYCALMNFFTNGIIFNNPNAKNAATFISR
ncbi:MAG: hypothetical protein MJ078_06455 [Clostridia bacterium]|nr:hypothetical protein [Clostridia bacterium]